MSNQVQKDHARNLAVDIALEGPNKKANFMVFEHVAQEIPSLQDVWAISVRGRREGGERELKEGPRDEEWGSCGAEIGPQADFILTPCVVIKHAERRDF